MGDRAERLATAIDDQSREIGEFLSGLTESDLRLPCTDPSGSTVGAVLDHLGEGYDLVLGWIRRVASDEPPPGDEHQHPHGDGRERPGLPLPAHVEQLRRGGATWAALVRGLSTEQLDRVPPATPLITDGSRRLVEILDMMVDHQTTHVDFVRQAVAAKTASSRQAT